MSRVLFLACIVLLYAGCVLAGPTIPFKYPLYSQCDPKWAKDPIGTSKTSTICDVGCMMSSTAMALAGHNITIDNKEEVNPGTLNKWLIANGGYVDDDDLEESVVPKIAPTKWSWVGYLFNQTDLSPADIKERLDTKTTVVIFNVMKGAHFVLAVGYDDSDTTFYVNDPGFTRQTYEYSDIVGYRIYKYIGK